MGRPSLIKPAIIKVLSKAADPLRFNELCNGVKKNSVEKKLILNNSMLIFKVWLRTEKLRKGYQKVKSPTH